MSAAAAASPARADPAVARQHFELGRRYFQVDEYRKAMEEFKAAHIEEADPAFLYNIAECHRRLGETKEALVYYKRFLNLTPPGLPTRATAEKRIAELQGTPMAPAPAVVAAAPVASAAPATSPAPPAPPATTVALAAPPPSTAAAPSVDLSRAPADRDQGDTPVYKKGWFYVVVGVAVAAGAAGIWLATANRTDVPGTKLGNQKVF